MLETYEFRLLKSHKALFIDSVGDHQLHGSDKAILRGVVGDLAYLTAGRIDSELRASGRGGLIAGWDIRRKYSEDEVAKAKLFFLKIPFVHLAGEEYGTPYEESDDCYQTSHTIEKLANGRFQMVPTQVPCGICSKQAGLLQFPFRKMPKRRDIYRLWGGELIISGAFSRLLFKSGLRGGIQFPTCDANGEQSSPFELIDSQRGRDLLTLALDKNLDPNMLEFWEWFYGQAPRGLVSDVLANLEVDKNANGQHAERPTKFVQLIVNSNPVSISHQSRFGENPFDEKKDGQFECKTGRIAGNRPISSLYVEEKSWDGSDICVSNVFVSGRQGLFRPHRLLLASKNAFQSLRERDMKGFEFEIATFV